MTLSFTSLAVRSQRVQSRRFDTRVIGIQIRTQRRFGSDGLWNPYRLARNQRFEDGDWPRWAAQPEHPQAGQNLVLQEMPMHGRNEVMPSQHVVKVRGYNGMNCVSSEVWLVDSLAARRIPWCPAPDPAIASAQSDR